MVGEWKSGRKLLQKWLHYGSGKANKHASHLDKAGCDDIVIPVPIPTDPEIIVGDIVKHIMIAKIEDSQITIQRRSKKEWIISPADFIYAYIFMMRLPYVSNERLKYKVIAEKASFTLPLENSNTLELTDYSKRNGEEGILRVRCGKKELLRVLFLKSGQENSEKTKSIKRCREDIGQKLIRQEKGKGVACGDNKVMKSERNVKLRERKDDLKRKEIKKVCRQRQHETTHIGNTGRKRVTLRKCNSKKMSGKKTRRRNGCRQGNT